MQIEILYFDGCPHHEPLGRRIHEIALAAGIDVELDVRRVPDLAAAERDRFLGSPTVRVDGEDVEPGAGERHDFGMKCRVYRTPEGLRGMPSDAWLRAAVERAFRESASR